MNAHEYKQALLQQLYRCYDSTMPCHLGYDERTHVVFGEGNPDADIMFIGEGPGKEEDIQGRPFVGRSGVLLNRVLSRVGIPRESVYITNIVKCRPPQNRAPSPLEATTCMNKFLFNQIKIIRPKIICTLGSIALNNLLGKPSSITKMRGTVITWQELQVLPTFHPAYILRNKTQADTWLEDFKLLKKMIHEDDQPS